MSFKGSFCDENFANDENSNNISLGEEDIKLNLSNKRNSEDIKCFINNEISIPSYSNNNIFISVPMELEIDNNYQNSKNYNNINNYEDFLSKELLKYHIGNIFNLLSEKIAIIKSNNFYILKKLYIKKLNKMTKAHILFMKISSSLDIIIKIINKHKINLLYQAFYSIKSYYNFFQDMKDDIKDNFKTKYEIDYKNEKNNVINQNNNNIKSLQKEIQTLKKNINQLSMKESELKIEIYNYLQEEKLLNEKINSIESLRNSLKKTNQSSNNSSSIKMTNKFDTEILSLENSIKVSKDLKNAKEKVINAFMKKMNNLLDEYQLYINGLKSIDTIGTNNNIDIEISASSNLQTIKHKEIIDNSTFTSKVSL